MTGLTITLPEAPQINATLVFGQGPAGPQGVQGPAGPQGPQGTGGDLSYHHDQTVAASVWTIDHNLGKRPNVTVLDSAGDSVEGLVAYPTLNQLTITFSAPFTGTADLN